MQFALVLLPRKREWRVSYPPTSRATLISHAVVVGMASASGSAKRVCALRLAGLSRICQDARQNAVELFETAASPLQRLTGITFHRTLLRFVRSLLHAPQRAWSLLACPENVFPKSENLLAKMP